MSQNPYREPFDLNTKLEVNVEKEVHDSMKVMSDHMKIPTGELVNTALRRFIATHSDYFPKNFKK